MVNQTRQKQSTALDILLSSSRGQSIELWLEYTDSESTEQSMIDVYLYMLDVDEKYRVSDDFSLPDSCLDAFGPFAEHRFRHIRVDTRPEEVRKALEDVTIPFVPIG